MIPEAGLFVERFARRIEDSGEIVRLGGVPVSPLRGSADRLPGQLPFQGA
jgi:hypothetical protein